MPDACDRRCCCSSHAATARITHTRNACPVSSYVAGKRLEQTLAGHPRIAPSPFAPVGPPHLPLTAVVWCLYRRPAAWATGQPHAKRKVGGAAGSATGALLAPTAPRRAARLGYVPRAQWRRGGWGYRGLKGEQGASEAAQPAAAGLSVTCGCCGQVRRCYCAERAVLPAPDVGWTGGSGG